MITNSYFRIQQRKYKFVAQALIGASFLLVLHHANAVDISKQITITAGVADDSNPSMAKTNRDPTWTYALSPNFRLDVTDPANDWYLDATLLVLRRSNQKVLIDSEDPTLILGWDHTYESGKFGVKAHYAETSAITTQLATTGRVFNIASVQKTTAVAAMWEHAISSRWTVLTEGGYTDDTFTNHIAAPGALESYNFSEIASKLTYAYTERLDTDVKLGYVHYHPGQIFDDTDLVRLQLGGKYQVKENFNIAAYAGVYNLSGEQTDNDWEGGLIADYTTARMTYTGALTRVVAPSSAGGFQKEDSLLLGWAFAISERDSAGAHYSLVRSKGDRVISLTQVHNQEIGAFYQRKFSDHWQGTLSAVHRQQDLPDPGGITSQGNTISVSMMYDTLSF